MIKVTTQVSRYQTSSLVYVIRFSNGEFSIHGLCQYVTMT